MYDIVEGLFYLCRENKGADQLLAAQQICTFNLAYAKSKFLMTAHLEGHISDSWARLQN